MGITKTCLVEMTEVLSLKNKLENHFDVLLDSVKNCSNEEPDILIITEEGNKIFTQRLLLHLYSPMMTSALAAVPPSVVSAISLPVSSKALLNFLTVLTTGIAVSEDTQDLLDIRVAAKIIGVDCENFQIGVKKKKVSSWNKSESNQDNLASKSESPKISKDDDINSTDFETHENVKEEPENITKPKEERDDKVMTSGSKKCECGKQFSTNEKLARHALVHTGIKPFECQHCQKAFSRKDKLKEHIKNKHV